MSNYYLLNNSNPNAKGGFHGYASRNKPVSAIVIHTAENNPGSNSAVAIGQYFSRTSRQASYHTVVDSSQALRLLPWGYTAFHVRGANSWTLGLSFATRAALWGRHPAWDAQAIEHGAKEAAAMAKKYNIPVRLISAEDARRGVRGFTTHAAMDPGRRSDPGAGFPMQRFLDRTRFYLTGETEEEDDMKFNEAQIKELQHATNYCLLLTGGYGESGGPLTVDGVWGTKSALALWHALERIRIHLDGPRSLYIDHENPSPMAAAYIAAANFALATRE